jgi:glycosyl hydrolase family 19 (putative chitinase)
MLYADGVNKINLTKLDKSVGKGGKNLPLDVLVVQRLLNGTSKKYTGKLNLLPDGFYGAKTEAQIKLFQKHVMKYNKLDSLVNVNKNTHQKLIDTLDPAYVANQNLWTMKNQKKLINLGRFIELYKKQYSTDKNTTYLLRLVKSMLSDAEITDIRWMAYMLATVKRECDSKWQPIEEYGKGKGLSYGAEIDVVDPLTKKTHKNVYYGRGYVQLTWDYNYKKMGKLIGVGDDLYIHPDNVLNHDTSYNIMSLGMRNGVFTNVRLVQYLSGMKTDYVGARKIINGTDHAVEIAKDAVIYQELFKASEFSYGDFDVGEYANYA